MEQRLIVVISFPCLFGHPVWYSATDLNKTVYVSLFLISGIPQRTQLMMATDKKHVVIIGKFKNS